MTCTNSSFHHPEFQVFPRTTGILIRASYITVASLGIVFNMLLCLLIVRNKHLRSIVNFLILNLAIGNIIACVNIYPALYLHIDKTGIHGHSADLLCGVTGGMSVFFVGGSVSIQTMTVLSISRYLVIHHPYWFPWRLDRSNLKYIVMLIWVCAVVIVIPNFISFRYDEGKKFCLKRWFYGVRKVMYLGAVAILNIAFPLVSLLVTYCTTLSSLRGSKNAADQPRQRTTRVPVANRHSNISVTSSNARIAGIRNSNALASSSARVQRSVVILLGMLILVYLVCWMPFVVYWFLSVCTKYFHTHADTCDEQILEEVRAARSVILAAVCSTVLYPLAYLCTNSPLRHTFCACVGKFCWKRKCSLRCVTAAGVFHLRRRERFRREHTSAHARHDNQV